MRGKRRIGILITIMLVFQLVALPVAAATQERGVLPSSNEETKTSLTQDVKEAEVLFPKEVYEQKLNIYNPNEYPLIEKGGFVATLYDSFDSRQSFFYEDTENYSTDKMKVILDYYSEFSYMKDYYFCVELYKDYQGTLEYEGGTDFRTSGDKSLYLSTLLSKATYANQQYLYIRVGVTDDLLSRYYSDVVTFKVVNPFYGGGGTGGGTDQGDSYALISNESINATLTEPTGPFSLNNQSITYSQDLEPSVYQIDDLKPFDPSDSKESIVKMNTNSILSSYTIGDYKYFWVSNRVTNVDESISARLAYSGTRANIWVNAAQITDSQAEQLGREFDAKIYSSVTNNFGKESDVNSDGKIDILCFDIKDGYSGSGSYIGGYFYQGDLYNTAHSNKSEIFYIDTYPAMGNSYSKDVTAVYGILAHEFQHMVNFNQNVLIEGGDDMPVWLDEGLSMAAEQIYTGTGLSNRVDYYNASQSIANGHSLLYWDRSGDTLANYALSYLFGQYVKIQANKGDSIFKEILTDPNNDYLAVENVAKKYINSSMTFGKLMTSFRTALLVNAPSGLNGFRGDRFFNSIKPRTYTGTFVNLRGGGAIAVRYDSSKNFTVPSSKGADITYTFLKDGDYIPPDKPNINQVEDSDTRLTGTAEANSDVFAKVGETEIGRTKADSNGQFTMAISKQSGGTAIYVYAQDAVGNISQPAMVNVLDKTPPVIAGVSNNGLYSTEVTVTFNEGTGVLYKGNVSSGNATPFTSGMVVSLDGTYTLVVTDSAGNVATVTFMIDKTSPNVSGVADHQSYNKAVSIFFNEGTATLNGAPFASGTLVTEPNDYTLIVTDAAGNKTDVVFVIDKTSPLVSGVADHQSYNKAVSIYFNEGTATLNGAPFASGTLVTEPNDYTLIVTDAAGNNTYVVFTIDKTVPVVSGVENGKFYNKAAKVYFNEGKASLNGAPFTSGGLVSVDKTYTLIVVDAAGNKVTVTFTIDKIPPAGPKVSTVQSKSKTIMGTSEAYAVVTIKVGTKVIGKATADKNGKFNVLIAAQKKNTVLFITATDRAGNSSMATKTIVK